MQDEKLIEIITATDLVRNQPKLVSLLRYRPTVPPELMAKPIKS